VSVDSLGWRMKFGVVVPSTNTSVQPEFDAMRPPGVTNHVSRISIPNDPVRSDADFDLLITRIKAETINAVDQVLTCEPGYVILGMSAETFWDGLEGSKTLEAKILSRGAPGVSLGSDASQAALAACGGVKRIAVITPYMPVGDAQVRRFFTDCGLDVAVVKGLRCASPVLIAHESEATLRDAILEVNAPDVDAIVQVGTNLAMARLAAEAERWLGKPVIAINTATYWHALRANGITDKVSGFGRLLAEF
jgi:maleate isomerase